MMEAFESYIFTGAHRICVVELSVFLVHRSDVGCALYLLVGLSCCIILHVKIGALNYTSAMYNRINF